MNTRSTDQMTGMNIGKSDLRSTSLVYGCWRLAEPTVASAHATLQAAVDAGYNHFDIADVYGRGECERIVGRFLQESPSLRRELIVTTKGGIRFAGDPVDGAPKRYDFSYDYLVKACNDSLARLGLETIDLYLLHRPDYLMEPAEVARAFETLQSAGKVRYFGVSNFTPWQLTLLQKSCPMPLVANQIEIHPARLDPFHDGSLDQCLAETISPMAWSPLGGGRLMTATDTPLSKELDSLAGDHGVTRSEILLAWLLVHPSKILPVIGTCNPERIAQSARAAILKLSREEWYRVYSAALGKPVP